MKTDKIDIQTLRIASQVFSPPVYQKIVRENDFVPFKKKASKYYANKSYQSNLDLIKELYKTLQAHYRCEYVYKNNLFNDIIIKKEGLKDTITVNEFKIGASKADLVLLNGSIRIYEVKTELDNFNKLSKQLSDYQKFADKVFIVTDEKHTKKLLLEYQDTNIGIFLLNNKNELEIVKEAQENSLLFCFDTIFKVLRKQEYLDLFVENFGFLPSIPNTKIFRFCYELFSTLNVADFQKQVLSKLKNRKLLQPNLLESDNTPSELKYICNTLDFSEQEYQKLYNFLESKSLCISHI